MVVSYRNASQPPISWLTIALIIVQTGIRFKVVNVMGIAALFIQFGIFLLNELPPEKANAHFETDQ